LILSVRLGPAIAGPRRFWNQARGYNTVVRGFLALVCVLAAAVAAAASQGASAPNVKGTFVRSPQAAVCRQGDPCDPPPQAAFLIFTRAGHSTRAAIGANGAFAVRLASGLYRVSLLPSQSSTLSPASIRVPRTGVIHPRIVQRNG
jgi:hypothetical protein